MIGLTDTQDRHERGSLGAGREARHVLTAHCRHAAVLKTASPGS
jgi:hypothetical protein